ncbi:MAG: hypothetical protein WC525_10375 [Candidatus Thermoplasmatota archaeon]
MMTTHLLRKIASAVALNQISKKAGGGAGVKFTVEGVAGTVTGSWWKFSKSKDYDSNEGYRFSRITLPVSVDDIGTIELKSYENRSSFDGKLGLKNVEISFDLDHKTLNKVITEYVENTYMAQGDEDFNDEVKDVYQNLILECGFYNIEPKMYSHGWVRASAPDFLTFKGYAEVTLLDGRSTPSDRIGYIDGGMSDALSDMDITLYFNDVAKDVYDLLDEPDNYEEDSDENI